VAESVWATTSALLHSRSGMPALLYGMAVESDRPLPDRAVPVGTAADVRVRHTSSPADTPAEDAWLPRARGEPLCARAGDGYLLRFGPLGDFTVSAAGDEVICHEVPGDPGATRHFLLDHVLPRVANLRGGHVLHASGVATPFGAVAFAGPSGAGKSTLAASFVDAGFALLSDDCIALVDAGDGHPLALPGYDEVRLRPEVHPQVLAGRQSEPVAGYTPKRRVSVEVATEGAPLVAIYELAGSADPATTVEVDRLSPATQVMTLARAAFRMDHTDQVADARQFRFFTRLIEQVPVRRLRYPHTLARLDAVRQAMLADIGALGDSRSEKSLQ
jgi:hypothetical protein